MTQDLKYENDTLVTGQSIQSDAEVAGTSLLFTDSDVNEISLYITWANQTSWQGCECYVIDPDGNYHYIFNAGSLPFGSGQRADVFVITAASGNFPYTQDGTWEFYLSDQMFNTCDIIQVRVTIKCTDANMPATYNESIWHNADSYRGGIDLTNNQRHVYPDNGAAIVADTGSGGSSAFSFDGTDDVWQDPNGNDTTDNVGSCSWSMWLKPAALSSKMMIFANHGYRKGSWQIYLSGATVNFFGGYFDPSYSSADGQRTYANTINTANQWYHVAIVFDGAELLADRVKIWIDNQSEVTTNIEYGNGITALPPSSVASYEPPLGIGGMVDVSLGGVPSGTIRNPFDGLIDDCRCWPSYKLTTDDITWLSGSRGVAGGPATFKPFFIAPQNAQGTFQ